MVKSLEVSAFILIAMIFFLNACNKSIMKSNVPQPGMTDDLVYDPYPFTFIEAGMEDWRSGIPGGGKGTEYRFKLVVKSADVRFDSVWMNNCAFKVAVSKRQTTVSSQQVTYADGDTIMLLVSDVISNNRAKRDSVAPPISYTGAACLGLYAGDRRRFFVVTEIKKNKTIDRP